jgi:hypothetical protein
MSTKPQLRRVRAKLQQHSDAPPAARHLAAALLGDSAAIGPHVLDDLPAYTDDAASGIDVARRYPDIKRHLDLCADCADMYVRLLQAAQADLQPAASLAPVEGPSTAAFQRGAALAAIAEAMTERMLARLAPQQLPGLPATVNAFFARTPAVREAAIQNVYRTGADANLYEARLVLAFVYFCLNALRSATAGAPSDWHTQAEQTTHRIAAEMELPEDLRAPLSEAFMAGAEEWRPFLEHGKPE